MAANPQTYEPNHRVVAYRICRRHCEYASNCAAEPMSCVYYRHLVVSQLHRRPGLMERLAHRLQVAWRRDPVAVIAWPMLALWLGYLLWHIAAAVAEGRLAVPLLR